MGKDKQVLLTLDQAGWQTAADVVVPEGVHLEFIPAYSPELQPADRLWSVVDEPIVNRCFETIEQLEQLLCDRIQVLLKQQAFIRGLTQFYWWPTLAAQY